MRSTDHFSPFKKDNSYWMLEAFRLAQKAYKEKEVPVGAIIVRNEKIIGRGYNQCERLKDPTAHAEILAITAASATIQNWRLNDCTIYVTKEPCAMCSGAIINSRLKMLVFGAYDQERGCCGSLYQLCGDRRLNSKTAVKGGVEEEKCLGILKDFFLNTRNLK